MINYKSLKLGKNGLPSWDGLAYPILFVMRDGKKNTTRELNTKVFDILGMPDDLKYKNYPNKNVNILSDRVKWAYSELSTSGCIDRISRGIYKINTLGLSLLEKYSEKLDVKIVHQQPKYLEHILDQRKEVKQRINDPDTQVEDQDLDISYNDFGKEIHDKIEVYNKSIATDLLRRILEEDPSFFENLVVKLLSAMGYQGTNGKAYVTQRSNDKGIDGVLNQDPLGTNTVYIQAKRYNKDNKVQRPALDEFYGALVSKGANRGVFITTSSFSEGALDRAKRNSIVTIDGIKLTELMLEYHVGVDVKDSFELFKVDEDFFD